MSSIISEKQISNFKQYLVENERSRNTISKYIHDVYIFAGFIDGRQLDKGSLVLYKSYLEARYAPSSANSMIAAANSFLDFIGRSDLRVKAFKIQRSSFISEEKELSREEYFHLVETAQKQKNERLALVAQTICATGIRVSELKFITVETVKSGRAEIKCKGKRRTVLLPDSLRELLKEYLRKRKITSGAVFVTRSGKPLDRSNIWRDMKKLCQNAGVAKKKVFPHNLRHLFARTFYSMEKDLSKLADILGHSDVNTTRIYTMESGANHVRLLEQLNLVKMTT